MELVKKHSFLIRWTHWIHFPLLSLMIWSGIWIDWANDVYKPFFPKWFYTTFHVDHHLAMGMAVHFSVMWLFMINGAIYISYLCISGEWRDLLSNKHSLKQSLKEAFQVLQHDLGFRKSLPKQDKFNAAQRFAYTGINLIGIASIISGLAIYKPTQLHWLTSLLGGYETSRFIHFICMLAYVVFFMIHLAQVIRAGWNNLRAMVTGYEIKETRSPR
jgi:thiosulfate reductase cytochrome b subunit